MNNKWSNQSNKKNNDYNERKKREKKNSADDLGEWIQDMVQDAIDSMDFSNLSQNIRDAVGSARDAVDSAREGMAKQMHNKPEREERQRYGKPYHRQYDSRVQKPVENRQPKEKGWIRKIPGRWSGPVRTVAGACGLLVFGALSLGFGFAGIGFSMTHGLLSMATIVLESIFLPLTVVSGVIFGTGRAAGNRVRRLKEYAGVWGESSFIMLNDLKNSTGYAMKRIQKDIHFLLNRRLIPYARLDESRTCLMLTKEAGDQYDAAVRSRREREQREEQMRSAQSDLGDNNQTDVKQKRPEEMTEEEKKMYKLQQTGGSYLKELRERKARIQTPEVSEKLDRLELLLSRIFVCMKEYTENISQADRLMEYYLPSVMKLVRVYEDMERQPIQSVNIIKTRMEIAESLDTVNQALESMYDDMFQDVAMDISSDIKVLETMLAKDGWGEQALRSQTEPGTSIWNENG